jgi:hypothetical protein
MEITLSQKEKMLLQDQKSHEELCIEKYTKMKRYDNFCKKTKNIKKPCHFVNKKIDYSEYSAIIQL